MAKSMLQPGKQHNFRVTVEATWTDAFNRLAHKHKWSANKTMNILLQNALNYMEQTGETITVDLSPEELNILLRLRQDPNSGLLQPTPAPLQTPVIEPAPVQQAVSSPPPASTPTTGSNATGEQKLSPRERALAQSRQSRI